MWLIIWWGSCNHQASFSFLFWDCVVEPFPLAATGSFLRDGTKMQHALPVCCMFSPWHNFYQNEATLFERRARGEEVGLGVAERECCIFFLGCWGSGLGLASRKRWRASPSFPIGSSNEDECLGFFFFLHHVASSQENTIDTFLLSSSSQSPSTYVATLSRAQNACI